MTTPINEHNMLTLDFWRDTVTYEGKDHSGRHAWAVRH